MKYFILLISLIAGSTTSAQQQKIKDSINYEYKSINWMTWDEALTARTIKPKKIFIFLYDDALPYSHKMDSIALKDTVVNIYLNNYYYCVRFDAQSKDTINYLRRQFIYRKETNADKGFHDLAQQLTDMQSIYPAMVIFDEDFKRLQILTGYLSSEQTSLMLARFAHNEHLQQNQIIKFGQKFQCQNPNHPHNRLRKMYQTQPDYPTKEE